MEKERMADTKLDWKSTEEQEEGIEEEHIGN